MIFCMRVASFSLMAGFSPLLCAAAIWIILVVQNRLLRPSRRTGHLHPEDGLVSCSTPSLAVLGDAKVAGVEHEKTRDAVHRVSR